MSLKAGGQGFSVFSLSVIFQQKNVTEEFIFHYTGISIITSYKSTFSIDYISSFLEIHFSIYLVAIYKIVHTHLTFSETSDRPQWTYTTFF